MNKNVIVTGAASGVGRETALLLANNNFNVLATSRDINGLNSLKQINSSIEIYQADLTDMDDTIGLCKFIKNGNYTILINNAGGGNSSTNVGIENWNKDHWDYAHKLNVLAPMMLSKASIPNMIKEGFGHIVIITSSIGHYVYEGGGGYTVSKHGESALASLLRRETFNKYPIRVTEISPGNIFKEENSASMGQLTPKDVAESIRWAISLPENVNIDLMHILGRTNFLF